MRATARRLASLDIYVVPVNPRPAARRTVAGVGEHRGDDRVEVALMLAQAVSSSNS